jgi:fructosamine-3-kinase
MTTGEYTPMATLYKVMPQFVPVHIGCGSYASNPDIHFFICELVNMTDDVPGIQAFCKQMAQLHSKGLSPNRKYGFHVPTYKGTIAKYTQWHDTLEESFHLSMKWFVYTEEKSQGVDDEMRELCQGIFDKVIPRLLRPLETGGLTLQPRLIHGDIWAGNCSTNIETNQPVIYDAACLYAHNESRFQYAQRECLSRI